MESNYLTAGDLALMRTEARNGGCYESGYGCHHRGRGMAATGIGLASGLGGGALLLAIAGIWGINQASKARARGLESTLNAQSKTMELLAATVSREASRQDGVNIDVQQTLRNQAYTSAYGGGANSNAAANALATAEAMALLNNGGGYNGGLNSAIGGCNYLRVARVSGSKLCGCGCGSGDAE